MPTKISYVKGKGKVLEVTGGCTECSVGCEHCWARKEVWRMAHNPLLGDKWKGLVEKTTGGLRWTGKIKLFEDALQIPLKRKKPTTYFIDSKADLFHPKVPFEFIWKVLETTQSCYAEFVGIGKCDHKFLFLTKRIERMANVMGKWMNDYGYDGVAPYIENIHLGVTICNQAEADEKIPIGLQIPGFDWISIEPMLGPVDFNSIVQCPACNGYGYYDESGKLCPVCITDPMTKGMAGGKVTLKWLLKKIRWVVVGCESGPRRRQCRIEWVRDIVQQCKAAGVPVFVKQLLVSSLYWPAGVNPKQQRKEWVSRDPAEWPEDLRCRKQLK